MAKKKEPVYFNVILADDAKANKAKSKLEKMADNIDINILKLKNAGTYVSGKTSQNTYESLFNAKLEYKTRNVLSGGRYRNVSDWHETKKAEVPDCLEDLVSEIRLSQSKIACRE